MIDINHIAKLTRIGLTKKEKEKYQKEFSDILVFANQLKEVKTSKIDPISHVTGLENVTRHDKARQKDKKETDRLLDLAPTKEERQIKVKAIL